MTKDTNGFRAADELDRALQALGECSYPIHRAVLAVATGQSDRMPTIVDHALVKLEMVETLLRRAKNAGDLTP